MSTQRRFTTHRAELRILAALGVPAALLVATRVAQLLTDQAVIGHLDAAGAAPLYLDAASQALLWMNVTFTAVIRGVCGAVSVLASQALGADNPDLACIWMKTGLWFSLALGLGVIGLWVWVTGPLLAAAAASASNATRAGSVALAAGADPVALAARYATLSTGWVLPTLWFECLNSWLIAHRK